MTCQTIRPMLCLLEVAKVTFGGAMDACLHGMEAGNPQLSGRSFDRKSKVRLQCRPLNGVQNGDLGSQ